MNNKLKELFNYDVDNTYDLEDKNILCKEGIYLPIDIIEYLMENEYKVNETTFRNSIENCDIDVFEYLLWEGCPFDKYSTYDASYNGCLRMLEIMADFNFMKKNKNGIWRRVKDNQNNFIFDYSLIDEAKLGGCPDCIEFVQEILG